MSFSNTAHQTHRYSDDNDPKALPTQQWAVQNARLPWVATPFLNQMTAPADSFAYAVDGRDSISVVCYANGTAPAAFSLEVWASHSGKDNSYVKLGAAITALGETKFTGAPGYGFIVFSLQSITTPGAGLTVEARMLKSG